MVIHGQKDELCSSKLLMVFEGLTQPRRARFDIPWFRSFPIGRFDRPWMTRKWTIILVRPIWGPKAGVGSARHFVRKAGAKSRERGHAEPRRRRSSHNADQ